MKKFKWLICFIVAFCMICGVVFAGCTVGEVDNGDDTTEHIHELSHVDANAATDDENGNIEYWYCAGCGKYFSDEDATTEISESDTIILATNHQHTLTHVEAKDATETEDGNIEYWYCDGCKKYFSDAEATTEITEAETIINALNHEHTLEKTDAVAATETTAGNIAYWHCTSCDKYFSDAEATSEISLTDTVIAATGQHTLVHHDAVAATEEAAGNIEYWQCSDCGKYFSDEAGTTEITEADTIIAQLGATATVTMVLPSSVSINSSADSPYSSDNFDSSSKTFSGYTVGDSISTSDLPSSDQLTDSNTNASILGPQTMEGWYAKETVNGVVVTTPIDSSTGYEIQTTSVKVAPYYASYDKADHVFNGNPGNSCTTTIDGVTWNSLGSGNHSIAGETSSTARQKVASQTSNTVIVEPGFDDGYAMLGTSMITNNYTLASGDYFRTQTAITSSTNVRNDNIEIYRFENYGSDYIKFKATLVNTSTTAETNYVYIYLAPGESAEYIYSVEYTSGDSTNSNAMIVLTALDSFTLNIGVSFSFITASSLDSGVLDTLYSTISAAGSSYEVGAGIINNTTASASDFVACITNSSDSGLTDPSAVTASLLTAYDIADLSTYKQD